MRKSLALLATTGALVAAAAMPAHAAPASLTPFTDATGDVVNVLDASKPAPAGAVAAADLSSLTFDAKPKSLTITWTVPKVHATPAVDAGGFAQSFVAAIGKAPKGKAAPKKMVMIGASNVDAKVKTFTKAGEKVCKTATVSLTATTATVTAPYRCLPGFAKSKKAVLGGQVMAADVNGLYSDAAGDWKGMDLDL